jgi:SAM-dependent methyltransferase
LRRGQFGAVPVLDVGAGYGVATIPALEAGATVFANDISPDHLEELRRQTPARLRGRLTMIPGRFPADVDFPGESLDAVHASQVLHFLTGDEVAAGLAATFRWLRRGGHLFVLAATPFQATHVRFIPAFLERKARGEPWPGLMGDLRRYSSHPSVDQMPSWLHVFDDESLAIAVRRAGYEVEKVWMFPCTGIQDFRQLDGREHVGLIARRPGPN